MFINDAQTSNDEREMVMKNVEKLRKQKINPPKTNSTVGEHEITIDQVGGRIRNLNLNWIPPVKSDEDDNMFLRRKN